MKSFSLIMFYKMCSNYLAQFLYSNFLRPELDFTSDHMILQTVGKVDYRVEGAKLLCLKVKVFRIKLWAKVTSTPHLRWERFWEILRFERFLEILSWERFWEILHWERFSDLKVKVFRIKVWGASYINATSALREIWGLDSLTDNASIFVFLRLSGFSSK